MGLLDNLFKPKSDQPEEIAESEGEGRSPSAAAAPGGAAPPLFLAPQPRPAVVSPFASASLPVAAPQIRAEPKLEPSRREFVVLLGDILDRVPTSFLAAGMHDAQREVRFPQEEFTADIARGRASVRLSRIAAQCPDVFRADLGPSDDIEVRLPVQKLTEQINHAPGVAESAAPKPPSANGEPQIELSFAAVLKRIPTQLLRGERPQVESRLRIAFPLALIERQLASGRVEVSSAMFVSAVPAEYTGHFIAREGINVQLPPGEIFQNLPVRKSQPPKTEEVKPSDPITAAARAEVAEPREEPPQARVDPQTESALPAPEPVDQSAATSALAPHEPPTSPEVAEAAEPAAQIQEEQEQEKTLAEESRDAAAGVSEDGSVVLRQLDSDVSDAPKLAPAAEVPPIGQKLTDDRGMPPNLGAIYAPIRMSVVLRPSPFAAAAPATEPEPARPAEQLVPEPVKSEPEPIAPPADSAPEAATSPSAEAGSSAARVEPVQFARPLIRPIVVPPPPVIFAPVAVAEPQSAAASPVLRNEPEPLEEIPRMLESVAPPVERDAGTVASSTFTETSEPQTVAQALPVEHPTEAALTAQELAPFTGTEPLPEETSLPGDHATDLPALAESLTDLPGVAGCVLFTPEILVAAGELPRGLTAARVRALGRQMAAAGEGAHDFADALPPHLAIIGDTRALHFFFSGAAGIGAWLATRAFLPGVRERLHAAADLLARSSTT
jgi:hypothetical protein